METLEDKLKFLRFRWQKEFRNRANIEWLADKVKQLIKIRDQKKQSQFEKDVEEIFL